MFVIESDQLYLFVILIGAVILLFTEWIRIDLTAVLIIVALGLTGVLTPDAALSGFSSEPAILLATVFVLNGGLYHTGLSEVAMAAVTSFFTPIGHHGNLLIYGPGGYQFSDFVKVGTPLTLIVAVIVSLMAPMIWPG